LHSLDNIYTIKLNHQEFNLNGRSITVISPIQGHFFGAVLVSSCPPPPCVRAYASCLLGNKQTPSSPPRSPPPSCERTRLASSPRPQASPASVVRRALASPTEPRPPPSASPAKRRLASPCDRRACAAEVACAQGPTARAVKPAAIRVGEPAVPVTGSRRAAPRSFR